VRKQVVEEGFKAGLVGALAARAQEDDHLRGRSAPHRNESPFLLERA